MLLKIMSQQTNLVYGKELWNYYEMFALSALLLDINSMLAISLPSVKRSSEFGKFLAERES